MEVGQAYVINTFDLGGCMKALPLIWKFPDEYKKHVVLPGPFHTGMNYMGMVTGNKCRGSGYSEILLKADLVTTGCLAWRTPRPCFALRQSAKQCSGYYLSNLLRKRMSRSATLWHCSI